MKLIAGPLGVTPASVLDVERVTTTAEMRDAVARALPHADILVMAAAPSDFRPVTVSGSKIKKSGAPEAIALAPTPDILRDTMSARRAAAIIVGFALETDDVLANGASKLSAKGLDLIVVNDAREEGAGFEGDTNRVTFLSRDGASEPLPLLSKREVADAILDRVERQLGGR